MFVIDFSKDWGAQRIMLTSIDWAAPIIDFIDDWLLRHKETFALRTPQDLLAHQRLSHTLDPL